MALNAGVHWGIILRIDVIQPIAPEGWKWLLKHAHNPWNFDGEIYGLSSSEKELLLKFGFRGNEAGRDADFVDVDGGFRSASEAVKWLTLIDVVPLKDGIKPFKAWRLKKSEVFTVSTLDGNLVTKGSEIDWEPCIGRL